MPNDGRLAVQSRHSNVQLASAAIPEKVVDESAEGLLELSIEKTPVSECA